MFYEKQKNVFGDVSHYYAVDPFHEGGKVGDLDVGNIYGEVQKEMLKSDADAVWVMQQWQGNLDARKMSQLDTKKRCRWICGQIWNTIMSYLRKTARRGFIVCCIILGDVWDWTERCPLLQWIP